MKENIGEKKGMAAVDAQRGCARPQPAQPATQGQPRQNTIIWRCPVCLFMLWVCAWGVCAWMSYLRRVL